MYPKKEEIMRTPHLHKPSVLTAVRRWKRSEWYPVRGRGDEDKAHAIRVLVRRIANIYEKPVNVVMEETRPGTSPYYDFRAETIHMNGSVSIISALHELAHHLFGEDETKACIWSVWLFKKTFARSFEKLAWQGHMLVKRTDT